MSERVVLVTAPPAEAPSLAKTLVQDKLAACVTIVPSVTSIYWWKGKIEKGRESLLVIKTTSSRLKSLIRRVEAIHSYSVPEVLAMPVVAGNKKYLSWLRASVKKRPV